MSAGQNGRGSAGPAPDAAGDTDDGRSTRAPGGDPAGPPFDAPDQRPDGMPPEGPGGPGGPGGPCGPTYRRTIRLRPEPGRITAEMADFPHHFRVVLEHRDGVVTDAVAHGLRVPWTTCPLAAAGVGLLAGRRLDEAATPGRWAPDRSRQCVHVLDLAVVAAAHARDTTPTDLEIVVSYLPHPEADPTAPVGVRMVRGSAQAGPVWTVTRPEHVRREAVLARDGAPRLRWIVDGEGLSGVVVEPAEFAGLPMTGATFHARLAGIADPGRREEVGLLRRACHIAPSRGIDLDQVAVPADLSPPDSSCYTFRPEVATRARRVLGASRPTELGDG